jgi:hypothetical protein
MVLAVYRINIIVCARQNQQKINKNRQPPPPPTAITTPKRRFLRPSRPSRGERKGQNRVFEPFGGFLWRCLEEPEIWNFIFGIDF